MPDDQPQPEGETPQEQPPSDTEGLRSALDKERSARKEAEKTAKRAAELEAQLKQYEDQGKSELEKAQSGLKDVTAERDALKVDTLRLRTALAKSLPLELADRLRGDSAEEMAADADRLLALVAPSQPRPQSWDAGAREPAPEGGDMNRSIRQALGRA